MPNWCQNNLHVVSFTDPPSIEAVEKFITDATTEHPEDEQLGLFGKLLGPIEGANWFDERIEKWGSKWDVYLSEWSEVVTAPDEYFGPCAYATVEFLSAWTPPIQGFTELSKKYPDLMFYLSYDEDGADFSGSVTLCRGEVISEIEFDHCLVAHQQAILPGEAILASLSEQTRDALALKSTEK